MQTTQHPQTIYLNMDRNQQPQHLPSIQALHPAQPLQQQQQQIPQQQHPQQIQQLQQQQLHQQQQQLHQHQQQLQQQLQQHQMSIHVPPLQQQQIQVVQIPPHLQQDQQMAHSSLQQVSQSQQVQQQGQGQGSKQHTPNNQSATTLRRGPWSQEEDRTLLEAINMFGPSNWVRISQALGSRTPKQCRERYHQNLKPSLNRNPISPEEGRLIEELVAKYGKRWAEIARHLNGRSDNAIKNWWNGGANRRRRASTQAIVEPIHQQNVQPLPNQEYHVHQPAFNTSIFQSRQQQQQINGTQPHLVLHQAGPLQVVPQQQQQQQQQQIAPSQMLPPLPHSRSSSISQEVFQQQPGVKRLLEEQNILPTRRHSTQTILTTGGSSSPFSISGSSRNSSISVEWNNTTNSNSTSRRSSLAHDLFPNPFQQQSKRHSSTFLSPSFSSRGSISGLPSGLTTLTISQQQQQQSSASSSTNGTPTQTTAQGISGAPVFKSNFDFSSKPNSTDNSSVKLPPPSSIQSNPNFTTLSAYKSTESLKNLEINERSTSTTETLRSGSNAETIRNLSTTETIRNASTVETEPINEEHIDEDPIPNKSKPIENITANSSINGEESEGEKTIMNISNLLS